MQIQRLSEPETDTLMKSLQGIYFKNWYEAFHVERNSSRTDAMALSAEKRTYFLVESYLVGVFWGNITALTLSSFARVLAAHPAGSCAMCLKALFETQLFPLCRERGKTQIVAKLEPGGVRVFKELQVLVPGIALSRGFYWDALVPVPV